MTFARRSGSILVLATAVAVSLACGKIAGIEDPPAADGTGGPGAGTTPQGAQILPDEVTFGSVACGTEAPAAQVISFTSTGGAPTEYKVELPDGTPFRLDGPLTGTIQPGAPAVTIKAFVTANVAGDVSSEVLVSVGSVLKNIPLRASGRGASVKLDPILAALGDVRMQSGGSADVKVHNGGNEDLVISGFDGTTKDFTVAGGGAMTVAAGQDQSFKVNLEADVVESPTLTTQLVPKVVGALCGPPGSVTVTGRRVNSDVTISPGDFGKQPCNTSPTKDVVITNYAASILTYTTSLPQGSPFQITNGGSGTIAKGSSAAPQTATISLATTAPVTNLAVLSDTLTVTITGIGAPAGGAHNLPVSVDVRGAILNAQPATASFSRSYWGQYQVTTVKNIQLSNTGNETVNINWNLKRVAGDSAWVWSNFPGSLTPGQSTTAQVGFNPQGSCPCESTGAPTATSGGPICNQLALDFKGN